MSNALSRELEYLKGTTPAPMPMIPPGRATISARLFPGALLRRARDERGVQGGAEDAVAAASSSSGQALPSDVRTKFEGSLGADLSAVRVHTGASSSAAADAVGARAYAVGNDIHFAAGQYAPADPFGIHLLAHEVAHTQQQAGAAPVRQHKLTVSSPGDAAEVEADRAADAMVSGASFALAGASLSASVHRDPARPDNPSYSNRDPASIGDGPARNGETERAESSDEVDAAIKQVKGSFAAKTALMIGKAAGLNTSPSAVAGGLATRDGVYIGIIEGELAARKENSWYRIGHHYAEQAVDVPTGPHSTRRVQDQDQLENALRELKAQSVAGAKVDALVKMCTDINDNAKSIIDYGSKINSKLDAIDPKMFKTASEVSGKFASALQGIDAANALLDRTALSNFESRGDFESAAAWGHHVGEIFQKFSWLGATLGEVIPGGSELGSGLFGTPAVVIDQFTQVVQARYAKIDAMTHDLVPQGRLLKDGESG